VEGKDHVVVRGGRKVVLFIVSWSPISNRTHIQLLLHPLSDIDISTIAIGSSLSCNVASNSLYIAGINHPGEYGGVLNACPS
jgi:hypothetical protein